MKMPENMAVRPHQYQLKGAAQILHGCAGPFRGLLLGDAMGLGKTLQGLLAIWARRHEPGKSLVVCPATLCTKWVEEAERSWNEVRLPHSRSSILVLI